MWNPLRAPLGPLWLAALGLACGPGSAEPPAALTLRVTGSEYEWHVEYPGPDGVLGTPDDTRGLQDLHVPVDTSISLELQSEDYVYRLRIPDLGVNEMAIPGLDFRAEFRPSRTGSFTLKGDQMCGFAHDTLIGRLVVYERADYYTRSRPFKRSGADS